MAKQEINIGLKPNSGGGDALRDAFDKVNSNFTEVYAKISALEDGQITTDVRGSVFADDSTLLVDAVNGIIPKSVIEDSNNWDTAHSWGDHSGAGYLTSLPSNLPYTYLDFNSNQDAVVNTKYLIEVTAGGDDLRLPATASIGDTITILNHPNSVGSVSVQVYVSGTPTNFFSITIGQKREFIYTGTTASGWINI